MAQINHTDRQSIERDRVNIQLFKQYAPWRFDLTLDVDDFEFPDRARVVVEATHLIVTERFDFGTVDTPFPSSDTELVLLTGRPNLYFRVKIVDPGGSGLILAEADRVPVTGSVNSPDRRVKLLDYQESEDRPLPWWMDFNSNLPAVVVNTAISDSGAFAKSNNFRGMNAAAIVEQVLTHLCFVSDYEDYDPDGDSEDAPWQSLWLRFIKQFNGEEFDPVMATEQSKFEWIDHSVDMFARGYRPIQKVSSAQRSG